MVVLVVNSGSSSIKFQIIRMEGRVRLCAGLLERIGLGDGRLIFEPAGKAALERPVSIRDHSQGIELILAAITDPEIGVLKAIGEVDAVSHHRVVHGGEVISKAELVTPRIEGIIEECGKVAPLHNPPNLMGVRALTGRLPSVPHVAVFDTAFHATIPEESYLFGLAYECYQRHGIRRFGFHGTSHRYVSLRAAEFLGRDPRSFACVSCHMGNGVCIAAIRDGRSVDNSLGFGTMCGAPMGTRAGDVDPAAVLHMIDSLGMSTREVNHLLYFESGLKGISAVVAPAEADAEAAKRRVGQPAAAWLEMELSGMAAAGLRIGLSWGTTLFQVMRHLRPLELRGVEVVQLHGGLGAEDPAIDAFGLPRGLAEKLHGRYRVIQAPISVASRELREQLVREPGIAETLKRGARADLALFGIGTNRPRSSSLVQTGFLSAAESRRLLAAGAVGTVCGLHIDAEGRPFPCPWNARLVGIGAEALLRIPRRVGVAAGPKRRRRRCGRPCLVD